MPLSFNKIVDKQLTKFFERTHSVRRYFTEPHLCWSFKGDKEGPTHNFVWNPLKVHCSLEGCDMNTRVSCSIIWVQGRHLKLGRQGMTIDKSHKARISSMNWIIYGIHPSNFFLISSMVFLMWSISLFKCGTLREAVPLDWFSCSAFSPCLNFWLWACPLTYLSLHCLIRVIFLVNSWFWRVNSASTAIIDCTCCMEGGYMTGVNWRSRLGWLEAFPLSWWPGLVAIDLL